MTRDSQKQALYDAERLLHRIFDRCVQTDNPMVEIEGVPLTLPPEGKFGDIASVQRRCDEVCAALNIPEIRVEAHRLKNVRGGSAFYQRNMAVRRIVIPDIRDRWAMRELILLHEMAHYITDLRTCDAAGHGPEYVANYVALLERVMAPEAGLAARLVFAANGVKEGTNARG